ncbi:MAG: SDR family oxidoreductase [Opitutales bacterium]|nr:SDR family oxidoreductase [Opitutales bacterium]
MKESRVAVITGAANGIGRAMAIRFAQAGFRLGLIDYDKEALEALGNLLARDHGALTVCLDEDLNNTESVDRMVASILDRLGRIDVLINNAAWRSLETMREISIQNWEKTLRVCLTTPAFLTRRAAESMIERAEGGVVINVSSVMADRPGGYCPAYSAAKAGMEALTRELAILYGRRNIRVFCLKLGNVVTALSQDYTENKGENISDQLIGDMEQSTPIGRSISTKEIAEVVHWLSSADTALMTGSSFALDGGFLVNFNNYNLKERMFPEAF